MTHPRTRAERRHQRDRVIANRKRIITDIWTIGPLGHRQLDEPGRLNKYNLNCGCKMCHGEKYFKAKRKRRNGRNCSESTAECRRADRVISL